MEKPAYQALEVLLVDPEPSFTLSALSRACGSERATVIALVQEGILEPAGTAPDSWRFPSHALRTARLALRLARDLELDLASTALVLDLLARIERLEAQLHRYEPR